jgi:hypothetical protein
MTKKYLILLLICFILPAWFASRTRAERIHEFLILYSNNVHGEMEPCG